MMKSKVDESERTRAFKVFVIQALYYTGKKAHENKDWVNYNWTLFCKERDGRKDEFFFNTDGKAFFIHKDRPPRYYGERFWSDIPAFMTKETAIACKEAIIAGGWNNDRKLRVVEWNKVESIETVG